MWFFKKALKEKKYNLPFTYKIIEAFHTGEIVKQDLDPHGISEIAVLVNEEVKVNVSWYSRGSLHSIRINGTNYPTNDSDDQYDILSSARTRASKLLDEKISQLSMKFKV
jgi:hypothetical protein